MTQKPILAIASPCYNEAEMLPIAIPQLIKILDSLKEQSLVDARSYILCADDGSKDATWDIIKQFSRDTDGLVRGIRLAHNRGQQAALMAALETAAQTADCVVTLDIDLQDDPRTIEKMVEKYRHGAEIVFAVRASRDQDTWFKRNSARAFYRMQRAMGVDTIFDHSDFRLMSRRAIDMLMQYGETNLFLRGIIPQIGLKTAIVTFDRTARQAGTTKYNLARMLNFSIDGITSFSSRPMRYIFYTGFIFLIIAIAIAIYVIVSMLDHHTMSGWASIILSIWFVASVMLMAMGIVGEYIGKIFIEVKHRPRYYISETTFDKP